MIVGILGPAGCGGTFIDWSLQYLSGTLRYLQLYCDHRDRAVVHDPVWVEISQDPLAESTAHGHRKTHPNDQSLGMVIDSFRAQASNLHSFYYTDAMRADQTSTHYNEIVSTYPDVRFLAFHFQPRHVDQLFVLQAEKISNIYERFSQQMGRSLDDLSSGALREILSLYYPRCIQGQTLNESLLQSQRLYIIDFDAVWRTLDKTLPEIFSWLGMTLDHTRIDSWQKIYTTYKSRNQMEFFERLDDIIDSIIDGRDHDLSAYNMTFAKEIVLASRLLYDHNLSLKFEGINDLSKNTQQWHRILEPNVYHHLHNGDKQ